MDLYGVKITHDLISQVTDAVIEEARAWQSRPLESIYPIVWLDGIVVKVQQDRHVINKSAHVVFGVNLRGEKEVLGLWLAEKDVAKFWLSVLTELKQRGVQDIYIACMDGLKGLPEAVNAVFPKTLSQLCIVHLVRASLHYVVFKDRKAVADALKEIYNAVDVPNKKPRRRPRLQEYQERFLRPSFRESHPRLWWYVRLRPLR